MPYASGRYLPVPRTRRINIGLAACHPWPGAHFGDFWGLYIHLHNNLTEYFEFTCIVPTDWVPGTNMTWRSWFTNGGAAGPQGNIRIGGFCGAITVGEGTGIIDGNILNDVRHSHAVVGGEIITEDTYVLNGANIAPNDHLWFALYRYGADPLDTCAIDIGVRETFIEYTADH